MKLSKQHIIILLVTVIASLVFYISAKSFSNQGAYIEVRGLSEQIVKSDTAIWSINFEVKSNDIDSMYTDIESQIMNITDFLLDAGFEDSEINVAPLNIYQDTYQGSLYRYNTNIQMSVYTEKVDLVRESAENTRQLIKKGIVMTNNYINFEFSGLNDIKPDMLAEATQNAKQAADSFAENSGSRVGKIVRANQGVFSINEKDPGSPEYKKVRIVSTLRYLLK